MEEEQTGLSARLKRAHSTQTHILVPAFGNCFYISIVLSYLLSVINNITEFEQRLDKLAELSQEQKALFRQQLLQHYNNIDFLKLDPLFNSIITQFKTRLGTDNWGGTLEDTQRVKNFLGIKIIELMEGVEDFDDKDKEEADVVHVFILRCQPLAAELTSRADNAELAAAKIASAETSGQERHFRVIDADNRIRGALDIVTLGEADEKLRPPLKQQRLNTYEVLSSSESPDVDDQPAQNTATLSFSDKLQLFQADLNQQLADFVATTLKNTADLSAVNWFLVIDILKKNFSERLAYVENHLSHYDDNTQDENEPDTSDRKYALYSRLVFMGVLCALNDELDQALEHFLRAANLPFYRIHELPHLWIVAIYFKQGKYPDVIKYLNARKKRMAEAREACGLREDQDVTLINYISPIYPYFTQLGDTVPQLLFLQFTHFSYPEAEFDFFGVAATQKLGRVISFTPEFYSVRADACVVQGAYTEALINYNKYPENAYLLFMKAFCLMMLGQFEEAKSFFEKAIAAEADPSQKLYYLNFYINILFETHEKSASRLFRDDAREILPCDSLSPVEKAEFILLNLKMLFSDTQLRFDRIFKEMQSFMNIFETLSAKTHDRTKLLVPFFKVCQRYARRFLDDNKHEQAGQIVKFIIEKYHAVVTNLKKYLKDTSREWWSSGLLRFPNWCFDRAFISVHHAFLLFCGKLSFSLSPDSHLFFLLGHAVETVSSHFDGAHISTRGSAGNNMVELLLQLDFYCTAMRENNPLRPTFQKIFSALKQQFPQDAACVETTVNNILDENGDGDLSDLMDMTFQDTVTMATVETQARIIKARIWGHKFFGFLEETRYTYFNFPPDIILIRMRHYALEFCLEPHRLDYILDLSHRLYNDIDAYFAYTKNLTSPLNRYYFTKHLGRFLTKNLLSSIKHFLDFLKFPISFPRNEKLARLAIVDHLLTLAEKFIAEFRTPDRRYKKLSFLIEHCRREFENMTAGIEKASLEKALAEAVNSCTRDPLDVTYGKKPYHVPFPRPAIISKLKGYKAEQKIRDSANLSSHFITIVYSVEKYQRGNQHTKTSIPIEIEVPTVPDSEKADVVGSEKSQGSHDILSRIQRGWDISRGTSLERLFPTIKPVTFSPPAHSHSEQNFFSYINKNTRVIFEKLIEKLPPGAKVFMIAFDMGSLLTSCACCRMSALAVQAAQHEFIRNFEAFLREHGFEVAGNKSESGRRLKATTRVLSEKDNNSDAVRHTNPTTNNIKHLKNHGIFQSKEPSVFISGQQKNARIEFKK